MGRSPKTEGASGRTAHLTARDGTSPRVLITSITYHPPSKPELHRPLAPSVTANAVPAPSRRELCGVPPQSISHDSFQQIVTSLTRPVSLLRRLAKHRTQSPPCQRGVPRHRRGGGIPQAKPGDFFPIHSSLFTKTALPLSTWVGALGRCLP